MGWRGELDCCAFGAALPGRTASSNSYRYGFNGKENDSETGTQDYGFRIYNPSLGKFLSVDPLAPDYPWYTPYQFAGNKPIWAVDLDGLEEFFITDYFNAAGQLYKTEIQIVSNTQQNNSQVVHRSQVNFLPGGNAVVTFAGSASSATNGAFSLPVAATATSPADPGNTGAFRTFIEGTIALGLDRTLLPNGNYIRMAPSIIPEVTNTNAPAPNSSFLSAMGYNSPPEYHRLLCQPAPTPANPNAVNVLSDEYAGQFREILYPGVTPPAAAASAYIPQGTNAVPQNPQLRIDGTGQVCGLGAANTPLSNAAASKLPAQGTNGATPIGTPTQILNVPTQQVYNNTAQGPSLPPPANTNTITIF